MNEYSFSNSFLTLKPCKHGLFAFFNSDAPIGSCLKTYGEWAEPELNFLKQILNKNSHVIDVGANIGTHTVFFSKFCNQGLVHSIEPQFYIFQLLVANSVLNGCFNVKHYNAAVSDTLTSVKLVNLPPIFKSTINYGEFKVEDNKDGIDTKCLMLDSIKDDKVDLIKIDVEGQEISCLLSAKKLISKHEPFLYIEFNNHDGNEDLIKLLIEMNYDIYWHVYEKFTKDNYNNQHINIWLEDQTTKPSLELLPKFFEGNIFCVPKSNKNVSISLEKLENPKDNFIEFVLRKFLTHNLI